MQHVFSGCHSICQSSSGLFDPDSSIDQRIKHTIHPVVGCYGIMVQEGKIYPSAAHWQLPVLMLAGVKVDSMILVGPLPAEDI